MRFRPCIDIHNGKVKQIVGSSLQDEGNAAKENFVSEYDGAAFARMYKDAGYTGWTYYPVESGGKRVL